jgi:APA family basic amino acid/polyamine antiporter
LSTEPTPSRRRLGLFDVLCLGVNATVGSGVFALPDDMQRAMGGWSPFAYVLCTLLLLPIALCFAELAGRFEETGGAFVYARHAFGDKVGFVVGWYCWAATFIAWAANTTLFIELCGLHAYPWNKLVAAVTILGLGLINYLGVKPGAFLVNVVVIGKLTAIFCFLAVALFAMQPGRLGGALPLGVAGVGQGIYLALFPLQGFEVTPVAAGETDNPRRNVPLGTLGALVLSALLFIVVQAALVGSYPALADESPKPLADAARYLGRGIGLIVLIGSLVSVGGFNAGSALGSPRYAQAIAARGLLPTPLARIHPRFDTPYLAIVFTTVISALLALFFDYRQLVGMSNVTVVIQYLFACLAVIPLRRRGPPVSSKAWIIPGGPVVPVLGALGSLVLVSGASRAEALFAAVALAVGVLVGVISSRSRKPADPGLASTPSTPPSPPGG